MARFDRVIPPGGKGSITLKVNTSSYQGKVVKSALVYTNDPNARTKVLKVTATIKAPISLIPRYVIFYGPQGQKQTRVVDIVAKEDKPLELTPTRFTLEGKVNYKVQEIQKGKKFRVEFTINKLPPGAYYGFLKLRTNYQDRPVITIRIRARVLKKRLP